MRTKPSVSAESLRYTPILPAGTELYVVSGPRHGSGYHWYEVVALMFWIDGTVESTLVPKRAYTGWVPAASRDGEAWLGRRKVHCPTKPTSVEALAALSVAQRLACFSGQPITVRARILPCGCSVTGPCDAVQPSWFSLTGEYLLLLPPSTERTDSSPKGGVGFATAPGVADGAHTIPIDKVVTVTGMFNHRAAAKCQLNPAAGTDKEPVWVPSGSCRAEFVVTSIK